MEHKIMAYFTTPLVINTVAELSVSISDNGRLILKIEETGIETDVGAFLWALGKAHTEYSKAKDEAEKREKLRKGVFQ